MNAHDDKNLYTRRSWACCTTICQARSCSEVGSPRHVEGVWSSLWAVQPSWSSSSVLKQASPSSVPDGRAYRVVEETRLEALQGAGLLGMTGLELAPAEHFQLGHLADFHPLALLEGGSIPALVAGLKGLAQLLTYFLNT